MGSLKEFTLPLKKGDPLEGLRVWGRRGSRLHFQVILGLLDSQWVTRVKMEALENKCRCLSGSRWDQDGDRRDGRKRRELGRNFQNVFARASG